MDRIRLLPLVCAFVAFGPVPTFAQTYFYPSKGQDQSLQSKDRSECDGWAIQQSGFSPGAPASAPAPQGSALHSAARGATVGVIGGAIGGDAGKGAAIGAATGALIGGMRRRDQQRQAQAQQQQGASAYGRALSACMQGRGYTVN
jgi:hypothetical protein